MRTWYTVTIEEVSLESPKAIQGNLGVRQTRAIMVTEEQLKLINSGLYVVLPRIAEPRNGVTPDGQSAIIGPNLENVKGTIALIEFLENFFKTRLNTNDESEVSSPMTPNDNLR